MINRDTIKNVLIIKLRYLGDVLLITPCLQALRTNLPDAKLTVAVNRGTEDVLRHHSCVDKLVIVDRDGFFSACRTVLSLRTQEYDLVLDLTDGDRSAIMARVANARWRVGYNAEHRWRGRFYDQVIEGNPADEHTVDYHLRAIDQIGFKVTEGAPTLTTGPDDDAYAEELLVDHGIEREDGLVMIHPGSRWEAKSWPPERFAILAEHIQRSGYHRVVFAGSEKERSRVQEIQSQMSTTSVSMVGQTTVLQLAAVMKRCVLFVSNDNGPMHMAAAMGLPVVGIFGPTHPRTWGPRGEGHQVLFKDMDCRACFTPGCQFGEQSCMRQISVEEVTAAVEHRLAVTDAHRREAHA